eukprot:scaffold2636_cov340-Pavlova_lutheri.AAC.89
MVSDTRLLPHPFPSVPPFPSSRESSFPRQASRFDRALGVGCESLGGRGGRFSSPSAPFPRFGAVGRGVARRTCRAEGAGDGADEEIERGVGGRGAEGRQEGSRRRLGWRGGPHRRRTHAEAQEENRRRMRDRARNQGA